MRRITVTVCALLAVALAACSTGDPEAAATNGGTPASEGVAGGGGRSPARTDQAPQELRVRVLERLPHDTEAFTQGLELRGADLYEGTGLEGSSSVRRGPAGGPPTVRRDLPAPLFGEGLTLVGSRLWQLTWQNGIAIEREADTLKELRRVRYDGEGWGLCHDGTDGGAGGRLVMSDGSSRLTFRDPETFEATGHVDVTRDGVPVDRLNELECTDDGSVYANVYQTETLVRIDPDTGAVTAGIDASGLLTPAELRAGARELNGIAAVPGGDEFLLTGKYWPRMFRVAFVPR
ncbi:glutaminyl-peptide cyclotransferase [Streptomyces sp. WMMC500]|uniref:glutaminyl-peptide cyclotransferase n=1 Tax=Streptomyces sp. WMMC500 TaxID=3015154 RepID=UPI00248BC306|nr:glutaminyl-peptide cyclotransferase [Streptomyces sp. WMMC500]WBB58824.1 glutaminyl-peptide cyclotransferase [Streptomyces sp. WMMC500]